MSIEKLIKDIESLHPQDHTFLRNAVLYLLNLEKDRKKAQQEHDKAIAALYRNEIYEMRKRYNELE